MVAMEVNFDGLIGPTHNYAGLSYGNLAASSNKGRIANPKGGALEGLAKMRTLIGLGMKQGILPPHDRPALHVLKKLGYGGADDLIVAKAFADNPTLMANLSSASAMWTANAATVSPRWDTQDGKTHFTPANLAAMYHRSIEPKTTARILKAIFSDGDRFAHHHPLEGGVHFGDEGAANHNRLCASYDDAGVALYVYGRSAFKTDSGLTFPGRQTLEASEAIARQHGTSPDRTVFWQQSATAINAGAFHNDVVAVSNGTVFFYHELAFDKPDELEEAINKAASGLFTPEFVRVPAIEVTLEDTIKSYLFNSQLISIPDTDGMTLILPMEVYETASTKAYVDALTQSNGPIRKAKYVDVRQSMQNGGGPACLRLRVVLDDDDCESIKANVLMDDVRIDHLNTWVETHYRDQLAPTDLGDPLLWRESMTALDELTGLLGLGSVYDFQL